MKIITVTGAAGGVGSTTVAAHLAAGLAAQGRPVVAFDFSPANLLRLHFGMAWEDGTGLAPQVLAGKPWNEAAYRSPAGIDFVPFGQCEDGDTAARFAPWLAARPGWFAERLAELDLPPDAFVVCDCPRDLPAFCAQVLPLARLALVLANPDAASYAGVEAARQAAAGAEEVRMLLNRFDPTRALDRDIALLLRTDFHDQMVPVTVHRDEAVREALAAKETVFEYAPSGKGADDFAALAMWLVAHLSHSQKIAA